VTSSSTTLKLQLKSGDNVASSVRVQGYREIMVQCPICGKHVKESFINEHIDSSCTENVLAESGTASTPVSSFFQPSPKSVSQQQPLTSKISISHPKLFPSTVVSENGVKRQYGESGENKIGEDGLREEPPIKKPKVNHIQNAAPLAERMRPKRLDDVCGQDLVGPEGVIRGLIEQDKVPSMIIWGGPGTGKTTIARLIAHSVGSRFVEINSTSSGVAECKKIFSDARNELQLAGRKTILFCDEIHRFSKSQQDVFLGPVEAGVITLIGATTENPSFKVINPLLSRCRTFTLAKLEDESIVTIMTRAIDSECNPRPPLLADGLLKYLASFSDGDARTALNLLELAIDLSTRPGMTEEKIKKALTQTMVYDRAGDQHYDTISAFHKSIRGGDVDASLYYLARMLQSGEDPLYIARRLIVVASEDVGLADSTMLPLATAAYTAAEKIGMPEARINLAHATVAMALAPKSTKVYRALSAAESALAEPGIAGLSIPYHLRNAPTKLMKQLGYGKEYKYNPNYVDGKVSQTYLPEKILSRKFLEDRDLGTMVDEALVDLPGD
jgi:putative ATPase